MDRIDIKMFLLHRENMCILRELGASEKLIKKLEQRWNDNEEHDKQIKAEVIE